MNLPDIYFVPVWGKAVQELDNGEACVFDFKNSLGHIYYQFIKREVPILFGKAKYYDTITPYGFNGPIILECDDPNKHILVSGFEDAFNEYCLNENIVAEYIRFNPWLRNHIDFKDLYTLKYNKYTVYTDLEVKDFFMEEYSGKLRQKIRKVEKSGIQLEYDFSGSTLKDFYRLYQYTIMKNNISDYYQFSVDFLIKSFNSLNNKMFLINIRYKEECITSGIFLQHGDYLHFHLVGNDYQSNIPNTICMVIFEACKWGQQNGIKQMHYGGAFTEELFAFKKQFTKNGFCDFYIGKRIRNEEIYNKLVDIKARNGEIKDDSYFPLYRG